MNEDASDVSGWGLDEIREDWTYVTNHAIDAKASALHAERLAAFDRALAAHDARMRTREPSDAQVLAAAIALTGGSAILFAELDTETQDRYLEDAHAALIAAGMCDD